MTDSIRKPVVIALIAAFVSVGFVSIGFDLGRETAKADQRREFFNVNGTLCMPGTTLTCIPKGMTTKPPPPCDKVPPDARQLFDGVCVP